jgi:hypothetical protein
VQQPPLHLCRTAGSRDPTSPPPSHAVVSSLVVYIYLTLPIPFSILLPVTPLYNHRYLSCHSQHSHSTQPLPATTFNFSSQPLTSTRPTPYFSQTLLASTRSLSPAARKRRCDLFSKALRKLVPPSSTSIAQTRPPSPLSGPPYHSPPSIQQASAPQSTMMSSIKSLPGVQRDAGWPVAPRPPHQPRTSSTRSRIGTPIC